MNEKKSARGIYFTNCYTLGQTRDSPAGMFLVFSRWFWSLHSCWDSDDYIPVEILMIMVIINDDFNLDKIILLWFLKSLQGGHSKMMTNSKKNPDDDVGWSRILSMTIYHDHLIILRSRSLLWSYYHSLIKDIIMIIWSF